jgi:hypothetical protein
MASAITPPPPIAGLLHAGAYPHPVATPVGLAETHVSWVLLTGDYAYKIKKPLRLGFLDYSTLERRRFLCEEEVRLNQRHAPGLYLGVSAVGGSAEAPRIDAGGPALEYAVRMRQFDAREELPALLAAGAVDTAAIAGLGAAVARLHAQAATANDGAHASPATVRRVMLVNFDELRALPECGPRAAQLVALEQQLEGALDGQRDAMRQRQAQGWIRECHGDLHCGNVVRWQGVLTPFDGLEFDPELRWIDVINDVAFLTMDLAERGRADLRRAALQAWCETLGDFAGLPMLRCYECYRALVRAKVAALEALQAPSASARRESAVTSCLRYLDWAAARLAPRRPLLLLTSGLSGSGKTWLAHRIAPALGALHLRSDVERKRLAGLDPLADSRSPPDGGIYTLQFNERTYERLRQCAGAALEGGESMVVDAAFLRREERASFLELARDRGAHALIVHCHAPEDLLRQRVVARSATRDDASEAGLEVLARQPGWWEDFDDRERAFVLPADTTRPDVADAVLAAVRARLAS